MIAAAVASPISGSRAQAGARRKKGCCRRRWIRQQERALAEVIQEQGREDEHEPGHADRALSEVAHVGVERLTAGDDEKHGAEDRESVPAVLAKE